MRAFVALEVPAPVREAIAAEARALRGVRPVSARSVHLTLRFLGEVEEGAVPALVAALAEGIGGPALALRVAGGGAFPSAARPRVLWAAVEGDRDGLLALAARVEAAVRRAFAPHLTLDRVTGRVPAADLARVAALPELGAWHADEVVLFRSTLGSEGARHDALARFPLEAT